MKRMRHGHVIGGNKSKTYQAWQNMKLRCTYPKYKDSHRYKGRGITYCPEWEHFENFLADMGVAPEGLSLDRYPNPNGNYCKENCRWATPKEQMHNTEHNIMLTFRGETLSIYDWSERMGIHTNTIVSRMRTGWSIAEALTLPLHSRRAKH